MGRVASAPSGTAVLAQCPKVPHIMRSALHARAFGLIAGRGIDVWQQCPTVPLGIHPLNREEMRNGVHTEREALEALRATR